MGKSKATSLKVQERLILNLLLNHDLIKNKLTLILRQIAYSCWYDRLRGNTRNN